MKRLVVALVVLGLAAGAAALFAVPSVASPQIIQIIDYYGDGAGNSLNGPIGIAVDGNSNVYVAGSVSDNAFKITSGGVISEIIGRWGDGVHAFDSGHGIAVDGSGNVYVAGGYSDNAFKITSGGVISQIIDSTGDGVGHTLDGPYGIAMGGTGNVYVAGNGSWNAFKIAPLAVGGIAEHPAAAATGTSGFDGGTYAVLAGAAAGVLAFAVLLTLSIRRRSARE